MFTVSILSYIRYQIIGDMAVLVLKLLNTNYEGKRRVF